MIIFRDYSTYFQLYNNTAISAAANVDPQREQFLDDPFENRIRNGEQREYDRNDDRSSNWKEELGQDTRREDYQNYLDDKIDRFHSAGYGR